MTEPMMLVPAKASDEMLGMPAWITAARGRYMNASDEEMREFYLAMIAAAPNAGKVTRERLREALDAAFDAGVDAMEKVPAIQETAARQRAEEDALAAALGLEVEW